MVPVWCCTIQVPQHITSAKADLCHTLKSTTELWFMAVCFYNLLTLEQMSSCAGLIQLECFRISALLYKTLSFAFWWCVLNSLSGYLIYLFTWGMKHSALSGLPKIMTLTHQPIVHCSSRAHVCQWYNGVGMVPGAKELKEPNFPPPPPLFIA